VAPGQRWRFLWAVQEEPVVESRMEEEAEAGHWEAEAEGELEEYH